MRERIELDVHQGLQEGETITGELITTGSYHTASSVIDVLTTENHALRGRVAELEAENAGLREALG